MGGVICEKMFTFAVFLPLSRLKSIKRHNSLTFNPLRQLSNLYKPNKKTLMKKLLLLMALMLSGLSYAKAEELTLTFSDTDWNWPTSYSTSSSTHTSNGVTLSIVSAKKQGSGIILQKNNGNITLPEITGTVNSVTLYSQTGASGSAKVTVSNGSTSYGTLSLSTADNTTPYKLNITSNNVNPTISIKATNSANVQLSKVVVDYTPADTPDPGKENVTLTWASSEVSVNLNEAFTLPELTVAPADAKAAVVYTSSNEAIAKVVNGEVEVSTTTAGTAVVTAAISDNDTYNNTEAKLTITVVDPNAPGTANNPYTVAQAIAACTATETEAYVRGVITSVASFNSTYGSITYYIGDTEVSTETLHVYGGLGLNGEKFTSIDGVEVGAKVLVKGNLLLYGGYTPEINLNSVIIEYVAPVAKDPAGLAFTKEAYTANLGETFTAPELTNPNSLEVAYKSSNEAVATVTNDGTVTILKAGTTTITATSAETEKFKAGEASYTLTVIDPNATEATFDFTKSGAYGFTVQSGSSYETTVKSVEEGNVKISFSGNYRQWNASGSYELRVHKGSSMTFTVPAAYYITSIELVGTVNSLSTTTANCTYNNGTVTCTGTAVSEVKIDDTTGTQNIQTITVKYGLVDSGIADIEAEENGAVEYFNLQGVRVAEPANGLYIRRAGNKVEKVIVR